VTELQPIGNLPMEDWSRPKRLTPDEVPLNEREQLVLDLVEVGVSLRKAEDLVARFPFERIRQQLKWLPSRGPQRPASLLIVAIERDFDAPVYGADD
jgi:hypothetical protein